MNATQELLEYLEMVPQDAVWRHEGGKPEMYNVGGLCHEAAARIRQLERELAEAKQHVETENKEVQLQIDAKMRLAKELEEALKREQSSGVYMMTEASALRKERDALKKELEQANEKSRSFLLERDYYKNQYHLSLPLEEQRDAARADAEKWRECAELLLSAVNRLYGRVCIDPGCKDVVCMSIRRYNELCHSPTLSSPPAKPCQRCGGSGAVNASAEIPSGVPCPVCQQPTPSSPSSPPQSSSAVPERCAYCGMTLTGSTVWLGTSKYCSLKCAGLCGPPAPVIAQENVVLHEATESRLLALESKQELLLRRTNWLLGLCSELCTWVDRSSTASSKIVWPDDLVPTVSTSTSPPTSKPASSGDASCG